MQEKFSEEARKILKNAKHEMQELKHPFVGSEHLILSILSFKDLSITSKLNDYSITYDKFKKELIDIIGIGVSKNSYFIYTPLLKRVIENAIIDTKEEGIGEVSPTALFFAILEEGEGVGIRILTNLGVNIDELYKEIDIREEGKFRKSKGKKKLSIYENSIDLVERARNGKIDPVIGRDYETNRLIEILLRKNKNNPLLLGEAGVGKTAIVENLALRIAHGDVPDELLNKKLLSISMASLVAGTKYRGEFEEKIEKIVKEIEESPDIIVFIDEIHSIVGAGGAEGAIDAANILKPALARGKFRLIGATTIKEYKDTIEKDKALSRRLQPINVLEPDIEETKNILKKIKPIYEEYHSVIIDDMVIDAIVNLSNKYLFNRKNPDKSIDILDEVCTKCSLVKDKNTLKMEELNNKLKVITKNKNKSIVSGDFKTASKLKEEELTIQDTLNTLKLNNNVKKNVTINDVRVVVKDKSNVPVFELDKDIMKSIKKLERDLKNKIIGQDDAIKKLINETTKLKLGLKQENMPISFLFTGKSGVGKTELVKTYANLLNMNLIRIDASEYNEQHAISKIIGSPPGYVGYSDISILDEVKHNPYSVILIDEIDKSCSSFINLFLQILDEGFITSSNLEKVYFNHSIIIMTCNKSYNVSSIGFNDNKEAFVKNNLQENFSLEFLNRIGCIINFNDLTKLDVKKIVEKEVSEIINKFKNQGIDLKIQKSVVNEIVSMSNYKECGARMIKKLIEDKIDNIVIENIINGKKEIEICNI
ncbi:MAG: ATP-dependent Clp protease ATP-binding subunit [Bacilli bacterium]|nr:ATP-dependent Clp protease ATP-binding subunit [Bacilli bacterium]